MADPAPDTPDWVRDAVFYQIFPDRFARSHSVPKPGNLDPWGSPPTYHGFQGGDLLGVAERLDYLTDLGVNAIYLTPIFQSAANHRYHTHDYEQVDPILGGTQALRVLLDRAHDRGIRVVLDGVFNHASRGFFPFHDILENGSRSPYLDWFHVRGFPLHPYDGSQPPGYDCWWGLRELPKFNTETPAVREYLFGIARKWVDFGIDGWRLDVPNEIDDDTFWREFRQRVRSANPEGYIVGEVWNDAQRWLQGDMWDAVMNYGFTRACIAFFIGFRVLDRELRRTSLHPAGQAGAEAFRSAIERLLGLYHQNVNESQLNLLGSHDTPRFLTLARADRASWKLATTFQMTYVGPPSIYYGDEIGLEGGHDPLNRGAFPWDESVWDHDLRDHVRAMIRLRHSRASLRRGSFAFLHAQGDLAVYLRRLGDDAVIVALNSGDEAARADLEIPDDLAGPFGESAGKRLVPVESGRIRGLEVNGRSSRILMTRPHD